MKTSIYTLALLLLFGLLSCQNDDENFVPPATNTILTPNCDTVECPINTSPLLIENECQCICDNGFTGENCNIPTCDNIIGKYYTVLPNPTNSTCSYVDWAEISEKPGDSLRITFYVTLQAGSEIIPTGFTLIATCTNDFITIHRLVNQTGALLSGNMTGNGYFDENQIIVNYYKHDGIDTVMTCSKTFVHD